MNDTVVTVSGTEQREAWSDRRLPPVELFAPDLWSIPVPMPPVSPLRYVSVYVLVGESGITLIDAGWDSDAAWEALCSGLSVLGTSMADVHGCLVTHQHFDHIGLARRIREASDAWIALHPADRDAILRPDFRDALLASMADVRWLVRLGASPEEAERLRGRHQADDDPRGTFAVSDRLVENGEILHLPSWTLRALHTPGHTPGHLCLCRRSGGCSQGTTCCPGSAPTSPPTAGPRWTRSATSSIRCSASVARMWTRFCRPTNGAFAGSAPEPRSSSRTTRRGLPSWSRWSAPTPAGCHGTSLRA